MTDGPINLIKDALVTRITANQATLGIKTIMADITLDKLAEEIDKLVAYFPAVIVVYYGRTASHSGENSQQRHVYSVIIGNRDVSGAHASERLTVNLVDALAKLIDNKNLCPTVQRGRFEFTGDTLQIKTKALTVYQLLFETDVILRTTT
jgi:hypothetical protein